MHNIGTLLLLNRHSTDNSVDIQSTSQSTVGQQLTNFQSMHESVNTWLAIDRLLIKSRLSVDQVSIGMSIKYNYANSPGASRSLLDTDRI